MVHTFVSSQTIRFGAARIWVASFSIVAHAGLITLAAVTSGHSSASPAGTGAVVPAEHVLYVDARSMVRAAPSVAARTAGARARKAGAPILVPDLTKLQMVVDNTAVAMLVVPDVTPELDIGAPITNPSDFTGADTHSLVEHSSMYAITHPGPNGAYTEDVVEKTAWPMNDNPRPRYPSELQRAGIEGTFVVQFVVDSTGRVDAKTLSFPHDAQPGFLRAVKDALLRSRYLPAELAGMRVRQLVQQQFSFVIIRR